MNWFLRPYQKEALTELQKGLQEGLRRQVLCLPTGAGKTVIAASILSSAALQNRKSLFIADRLSLVDQTSERLQEYGVDHGIIQANRDTNKGALVTVASAQTLESRGIPDCEVAIVDECHHVRKVVLDRLTERGTLIFGLSATPFTEGMRGLYEKVANCTTTNELIKKKWLVPLKVYVAKEIDMRGAATSGGEWTGTGAAERAAVITADIISEWEEKTKNHFGGPVKTLVFTPTVAYGAVLVERFRQAGYIFRQVSYRDTDSQRRDAINAFRHGECTGLVSVDALAKGFDVPDVQCMVAARPYRKSFAAHIQQLGRGMRPFPDKEYCLLLDHTGNYLRFAAETEVFFEDGIQGLEEEREKGPAPLKECPECHAVVLLAEQQCPECGYVFYDKEIDRDSEQDGELVEYRSTDTEKVKVLKWARKEAKNRIRLYQWILEWAITKKRGDPYAARPLALAAYKGLMGRFPTNSNKRPRPCPSRLEELLERERRAYFVRKNKRRRAA